MIHLTLDQTTVAVGSRLAGTLTCEQVPKQATLDLRWYTEGRGTRDRQIIQSLTLNPEKIFTGKPLHFELQIPDEGPITYNGSLLRILWEVKARVSYLGLLAAKDNVHQPLIVLCR
jgi:hypothetical protein